MIRKTTTETKRIVPLPHQIMIDAGADGGVEFLEIMGKSERNYSDSRCLTVFEYKPRHHTRQGYLARRSGGGA
jgi:hypothetical protein